MTMQVLPFEDSVVEQQFLICSASLWAAVHFLLIVAFEEDFQSRLHVIWILKVAAKKALAQEQTPDSLEFLSFEWEVQEQTDLLLEPTVLHKRPE